ncbi:MAG: hypothetical protein HC912_04420 [Saprospiraceae bacterium]|nr:hypothetical protein [Saprospiraceae bacterium]
MMCVFSLPALGISQSNKVKIDERLFAVFEQTYLEQLQTTNPFLIQRWNYYLDHAYYIAEDVKTAQHTYPEVAIDDLKQLNIFLLEKEQGTKGAYQKEVAYRISGTNKVLVYYAAKDFTAKLNKHLGRTN